MGYLSCPNDVTPSTKRIQPDKGYDNTRRPPSFMTEFKWVGGLNMCVAVKIMIIIISRKATVTREPETTNDL